MAEKKEKESKVNTSTIQVEIFGQYYHIRAGEDGEYLKQLAKTVDQKMRDICGSAAWCAVAALPHRNACRSSRGYAAVVGA